MIMSPRIHAEVDRHTPFAVPRAPSLVAKRPVVGLIPWSASWPALLHQRGTLHPKPILVPLQSLEAPHTAAASSRRTDTVRRKCLRNLVEPRCSSHKGQLALGRCS